MRVSGPSPLSSGIQPPAPPLMHRLHQYLGTLVRVLLHLPTFTESTLSGEDKQTLQNENDMFLTRPKSEIT